MPFYKYFHHTQRCITPCMWFKSFWGVSKKVTCLIWYTHILAHIICESFLECTRLSIPFFWILFMFHISYVACKLHYVNSILQQCIIYMILTIFMVHIIWSISNGPYHNDDETDLNGNIFVMFIRLQVCWRFHLFDVILSNIVM